MASAAGFAGQSPLPFHTPKPSLTVVWVHKSTVRVDLPVTVVNGMIIGEVTSMKKITLILWPICLIAVSVAAQETNTVNQTGALPANTTADFTRSPTDGIWTSQGVGEGFRPHLQEVGVSEGAGWATHEIGGKIPHDMLLTRLYYGCMLGNRVAADKWYGGNWEFLQEVFGAWQYHPSQRYLTGTTSMLRYNFATGTKWVPFIDGGVGFSLTDIANPDLGTPGEFNGQIGPGFNYFWRDNAALTLQYRYMHTSDGGLGSPNQGVNENIAYVGVSWFF